MNDCVNVLEGVITIIGATIAGGVLLKVSTLEYVQKKQRAHWFFDEYMLGIGKCIADYDKNKETYFSFYMRYLIYADNEIAEQMKKVDMVLKGRNEEKIISEVEKLKQLYSNKYDMSQYYIRTRKRHFIVNGISLSFRKKRHG